MNYGAKFIGIFFGIVIILAIPTALLLYDIGLGYHFLFGFIWGIFAIWLTRKILRNG
jgi:hypothetical protein